MGDIFAFSVVIGAKSKGVRGPPVGETRGQPKTTSDDSTSEITPGAADVSVRNATLVLVRSALRHVRCGSHGYKPFRNGAPTGVPVS